MVSYIIKYAFVLLAASSLTACTAYYEGPVSDHFDGSQFSNHGKEEEQPYARVLWEALANPIDDWPTFKKIQQNRPPKRVAGSKLRVTFIGHASVLLQTENLNILTDPVWAQRASPVSWAGPERIQPPGVQFDNLPPIDLILISHNHYDHMDFETIASLWRRDKPLILVPLGNDMLLLNYDKTIRSKALDWGESHQINERVKASLEPMYHWSSRWGVDARQALWGAFVIETPSGNIYFAGDSGFDQGRYYKQAHKEYGGFRLALLPIGTYKPRWFFNFYHQDPSQALQAHQILNASYSLAVHFGTFDLSLTPYDEPPRLLEQAKAKENIAKEIFRALKPGQIWWVPEVQPRQGELR